MITQELKDKGFSCRGQGLSCRNCKDKNACIDYVKVEGNPDKEICCQCYGECKKLYQVKVIDEVGKMTFEKTCSEECALEVKEDVYIIHKNRADEMKHQQIQRLR